MSTLVWKDEYSVGIESIDNQHKKLVEIMASLQKAMKERKSKEVLSQILLDLKDYTKKHFYTEEILFQKHGYPQKQNHVNKHEEFVKQVADFIEDYQAGKLFVSMKIMNFLWDWLTEHILRSDKAYSSFLIEKGVK